MDQLEDLMRRAIIALESIARSLQKISEVIDRKKE